MADTEEEEPFARLLEALEQDKVPYMLIGMSAAFAQGVMCHTIDVDIWIGLNPRQYMRVNNLAIGTGAQMVANSVVYLTDGTPVNFVYEVDGLPSFRTEFKKATTVEFLGCQVPVLPLDRIRKSKEYIGRDKDLTHILQIDEFLACAKPPPTAKKQTRKKSAKRKRRS